MEVRDFHTVGVQRETKRQRRVLSSHWRKEATSRTFGTELNYLNPNDDVFLNLTKLQVYNHSNTYSVVRVLGWAVFLAFSAVPKWPEKKKKNPTCWVRLSSWDSKPIWDEENSTLRFDLRKGPVQEEPYNTREVQNNNKKKKKSRKSFWWLRMRRQISDLPVPSR